MPRLPQPGSDEGTWGEILNDYLSVSHNTDGTLKNGVAGTSQIQDGSLTPGKLSVGAPVSGQVLSYNGTGFAWIASPAGVTDHGLLSGLSDDDHPQYHTDARGDARYYTQAQVDTSLSSKANASHAHVVSDTTGLQAALDAKAPLASPTFTGTLTAAAVKITGGTPASGKVLTSDADGDATWETPAEGITDHTLLSNIGTNTHAQIDTALANSASHIANTSNPHVVTKAQVGLSNVDNTSDANKPISTATQTALDGKAAASHTHVISDTTGLQAALDGKAAADPIAGLNKVLVLGPSDPVPGGTPTGTIILRTL